MSRISSFTFASLLAALTACGGGSSTGPSDNPAPVHSIQLSSGAAATVFVDHGLKLVATLKDSTGQVLTGRALTWHSATTTVATISASGDVLGLTQGQSVITATSEGQQAQVTITVAAAPVATVSIVQTAPTVKLGETTQLTTVQKDDLGHVLAGRTVTWSSSAPAIASVNAATGLVSGAAAGNAVITAMSEGKQATVQITVQVPVASVLVATALDTLEAFDARQLLASARDANGNELPGRVITWASSNPLVASVDPATGVLTGVDRGTVTITATSETRFATVSRVVVIKYRSITAGTMHACDIASGGRAFCWGLNGAEGRIGSAQMGDNQFSSTPLLVPGNHKFQQLVTFARTTCGLDMDGKAWCWGTNGWGVLGANSALSQSNVPLAVAGNHVFRKLTMGTEHACGIELANGSLWCWGHNDWRQLAAGTIAMTDVPVAAGPLGDVGSIAAGSNFTCASTVAGTAWCWGGDGSGQSGDGGTISYGNTFKTTPTAVAGGHLFQSVSAGSQYACGITQASQAFCWGANNGKLGNGATIENSTPQAVSGGLNFQSLSAGYDHTCGITTLFEIWCWGSNGYGQLGNAVSGSIVPVRAGGTIKGIEVASAGIGTGSAGHTCAISQDRLTAWCWGRNDVGQAGNGTTTSPANSSPVPSIIVGQKPL